MNRKLLNGLLVLAVAAGGVGTFTSCKDENFADNVRLNQEALQAQIDAIRSLDDKEFYYNLYEVVQGWINDAFNGESGTPGTPGTPGTSGTDGKDAVVLTLTPPIISLQYTAEGALVGSYADYTSIARVYKGSVNDSQAWSFAAKTTDTDNVTVSVATDGVITVVSMAEGKNYGTVTIEATKTEDGATVTLDNVLIVQKNIPGSTGTSGEDPDFLNAWLEAANAWTTGTAEYPDGWTNPYNWGYEDFVKAGVAMYDIYQGVMDYKTGEELSADMQKYVNGLYQMLFDNVFQSQDWFKQIYTNASAINNLLQRATSVSVNHVYNPVFGTINLPVGINSTVLATYMYKSVKGAYAFPAEAYMNLAEASPYNPMEDGDYNFAEIIYELTGIQSDGLNVTEPGVNVMLPGLDVVDFALPDEFGNMGGAVVAINPSSNDFSKEGYTVELVNSKGEAVLSSADEDECGTPGVELGSYDDVIYFGASRADNAGVYALKVNANNHNWYSLGFDLDSEKSNLKDALKQAIDNKKLSDIAHLGEIVFRAFNNQLPAYAVRVSWDETDAEGNVSTNSVYSDFDLAAAVVHPLSYDNATNVAGYIPNKRLPIVHSTLTEILDKIKNKINIKFNLTEPTFNEVTIEMQVYVENGKVYPIKEGSTAENPIFYYGEDGQPICWDYSDSGIDLGSVTDAQLSALVNAILSAGSYELADAVNADVINQIKNAFNDINKQIEEQIAANVGDFQHYIDDLENSKKLSYAQKLLDIYNKLAEKANHFLDNPSQYFQVAMAYSAGDGAHHMSTDPYMPVRVYKSEGNAVALYATSYTGDVLVPSFRKYVAITGVVNPATHDIDMNINDLVQYNKNTNLNKVIDGKQQKVVFNYSGLPEGTYRLTYISVDYRGISTMQNYYLKVLSSKK